VRRFDPERSFDASDAGASPANTPSSETLGGAPEAKESAPLQDESNSPLAESAGHLPVVPHAFRWRDLVSLVAFYLFTGAALAWLATILALRMLDMSLEDFQASTTAKVAVVAISQAMLSAATLAFLYLMVRSRGMAPFWTTLGWRALSSDKPQSEMFARFLLTGAGLAVLIQATSYYLGTEGTVPMEELFRNRASVLMMMALGILVAPLIEETIFRGCIYPVFARTFGVTAGVVLTGALFGLSHGLQLAGAWKQVALLMAVGIFLTYIRARTGTVLASYLVHLGYNTLLFVALYVGTGGLRNFPNS
jgi:membrane protease YdiL (CAAX protease family)